MESSGFEGGGFYISCLKDIKKVSFWCVLLLATQFSVAVVTYNYVLKEASETQFFLTVYTKKLVINNK